MSVNILSLTHLSETFSTAIVLIGKIVYNVHMVKQPTWHVHDINIDEIYEQEYSDIRGAEETLQDHIEINEALDYYFNIQYFIDFSNELGHD